MGPGYHLALAEVSPYHPVEVTAARLEEAAEHVKKGRWAKAIEVFRAVLADEPENVELRVALADTYKKAKNGERAFHHYHRAAMLFLGKGEYNRAAVALSEANTLSPNTPDVLWRLCEAMKAIGRIEECVPHLVALIRAAAAPGDRRRLWALEELFVLHPDDLSVGQQRAEALGEAGRVDESVLAYKKLAARLSQREHELVQVLFRAAKIAEGRPDLGADLANVLIAHGRGKDALAVIVGFYEKAPDDIAVLETLLRSLEAIGANDKAIAARVELLKARAATGARSPVIADVEALMIAAPDDPMAIEVCAHALVLVREPARALDAWRRLMRICERRGLKNERDRAVHQVLKSNPDDEEALELAAVAHAAASRFNEADAIRKRLVAVRALKRRSLVPPPPIRRTSTPPMMAPPSVSMQSSLPMAGNIMPASEDLPTGTMQLSDSDVIAVRGPEVKGPRSSTSSLGGPIPSNPWFEGREAKPENLSGDRWYEDDERSSEGGLQTVEGVAPSRKSTDRAPAKTDKTPLPRHDTATDEHAAMLGTVAAWEEPTTMDQRIMEELRGLTQANAATSGGEAPELPGELTNGGLTSRSNLMPGLVDDLVDEP